MDSRYYQDKINRLDKDIADIEKKIAAESKIEADKSSKIAAIQRSITKNTSMSSLNLKQRQMSNYNREMNTAQVRRADLQKKLADKRAGRAKYSIELQKAVARENKQNELNQKKLQEQYEQMEQELTGALDAMTERGSASSLLALLPQEFATADLIKLRARKGQSVTPTSINSLLCRWRKLNRIDKTADGHWKRLQ